MPTTGSRAASGTVTPLLRQYRGCRFVHTYGIDVNAAVVRYSLPVASVVAGVQTCV